MSKITVINNESEKVTLLLTKTFPPPADTEQCGYTSQWKDLICNANE